MNKKFITITTALGLLLTVTSSASAITRVPASQQKAAAPVTVTIPAHAVEVAPDIFYLGTSVDADGILLEGYAIIDRRLAHAKPSNPGNSNGGGGTTSTCYAYLGQGAKWLSSEPYRFNTTNTAGLNETTVSGLFATALEKWDSAAGVQVFGDREDGIVDAASIGAATNEVNEVVFGSINSPGAIAVTYVWGNFSGKPANRYLAEWDMVYDQADFAWSAEVSGIAGKMDFDNITTHEIGHAAGMGHPSDSCINETMYRFADVAETKKRDLNAGDIAGVSNLY